MNKTHGLVASAWMLGSGMLLNASLTAEAQDRSTVAPEEYYAPQRTTVFPAKKTPGLLPANIRNADSSKSGSVVRPIVPTNSSLAAGRKMNGAIPMPTRTANRSDVMTATHQPNGVSIQTINDEVDTTSSPIQRQLEELYRKDGRPMPQMNFHQTPVPADGHMPSAEGGNRPNVIAPSNTVPPKPRSFFERINPFSRKKTAPAPLPQTSANPIQHNAVRAPQQQPVTAPIVNGVAPAAGNQDSTNRFNSSPANARPNQFAPSRAISNGSQLPDTLPPVPGDAGYQGSATKSGGEVIAIPPAPASIDEALENAFIDPVDEKSGELPTPNVEAKPIENDNPFSGLSLDDEFGPAAKPAKPASAKLDAPTADEPVSEEKGLELPIDNAIPLPPEAAPAKPNNVKIEVQADEKVSVKESANEEVDLKMKLIAERGELRGLKGFCPVMLRDERDLKNALPEHHSTFKGRTYYFSSAEAKSAFDANPQQYAPMSGGQDVVMLKEKVTKEGSLDHAVWFKDRLYLFTSQKTLEQFVATPKEFAISE